MQAQTVAKPPPTRLPWRQLAWATALSLFVHSAVLTGVVDIVSLSFEAPPSLSGLRTRTIPAEPVPEPQASPAPAPVIAPPAPPSVAEPAPASATPQPQPLVPVAEPASVAALPDPVVVANTATEVTASKPKQVVIALTAEETTSSATSASAELTPALQLKVPGNISLQYIATTMQRGQSREGRGQLTWQTDGQAYALKIEATYLLATVLEWNSVGKITEVGLAPERFSERRLLRSEQATHFRPELGKIQFSNNKPDALWQEGVQDRLSMMLLLSSLFAGSVDQIEKSAIVRVQVASTDAVETWDVRFEGWEEISLPSGPLSALKLARDPRHTYDRKLEFWLAPSLGFMPVRILQVSTSSPAEDFFDLKLSAMPMGATQK